MKANQEKLDTNNEMEYIKYSMRNGTNNQVDYLECYITDSFYNLNYNLNSTAEDLLSMLDDGEVRDLYEKIQVLQ